MENDNIQVPRYILEQVNYTLLTMAELQNSPERETCLDRDIMESWNMTHQLLEKGEYLYSPSHRLKFMQTPNDDEESTI